MSPPLAEELARLLRGRIGTTIPPLTSAELMLADPLFLILAARVVLEKGRGITAGSIVASYLRAVAEGGTP